MISLVNQFNVNIHVIVVYMFNNEVL